MARYLRFTFLCNLEDRQAIATLAKHLQRSQSDAVRFVVLDAAKKLAKADLHSGKSKPAKQEHKSEGNNDLTI